MMKRKLVIEGNAVYEIDENCMLGKRQEIEKMDDSEEDNQGQKERETE